MSAPTGFAYKPGASFLHRLDPRVKLLALAAAGPASLHSEETAFFLCALFLTALTFHLRLSLRAIDRELRIFLLLLSAVFLSRAALTGGNPVWNVGPLTIASDGVRDGARICARMAVLAWMGWIFIATTSPAALRASVQALLKPAPGIPGNRVAAMLMLTVRLAPVLLDRARETADAQRARGVENRRNPVFRMKALASPWMRRSFAAAAVLAEAMEARCYDENRTGPSPAFTRTDAAAAVVVIILFVAVILSE